VLVRMRMRRIKRIQGMAGVAAYGVFLLLTGCPYSRPGADRVERKMLVAFLRSRSVPIGSLRVA